jgi:hypothetical protein
MGKSLHTPLLTSLRFFFLEKKKVVLQTKCSTSAPIYQTIHQLTMFSQTTKI